MQSFRRIFSILCFLALTLSIGVPTAAAESRVNGFFRADLVKSGVFESGLRRTSLSTRSIASNGVAVPLKAVRSRIDAVQAPYSEPKRPEFSSDSAEKPANEWDVGHLYPNLR